MTRWFALWRMSEIPSAMRYEFSSLPILPAWGGVASQRASGRYGHGVGNYAYPVPDFERRDSCGGQLPSRLRRVLRAPDQV